MCGIVCVLTNVSNKFVFRRLPLRGGSSPLSPQRACAPGYRSHVATPSRLTTPMVPPHPLILHSSWCRLHVLRQPQTTQAHFHHRLWAPWLCKSLESCTSSSNTNAMQRQVITISCAVWSHGEISEFSIMKTSAQTCVFENLLKKQRTCSDLAFL